jgi:hypothetical protein
MPGIAVVRHHHSPRPPLLPKDQQPLRPPARPTTASMVLFGTRVWKSPPFVSPSKRFNNVNLNIAFVKYQKNF